MIKLASNAFLADQDLLHQRDRQRLRGGRGGRRATSPAGWASTIASARSSCRPGSATAEAASPRTSPRSSSWPANTGYHFQLLNAVIEVNELQKRRVIGKLSSHLGSLVGQARGAARARLQAQHRRHARGATSLVLAARLEGEGARSSPTTRSRWAGPPRRCRTVEMCDSALEALDGADAAVLVTEWPEFAELDWAEAAKRMARPLLVDGRNFLDAGALRGAGFDYEGIGREVEVSRGRRGLIGCRRSSWSAARGRGCGR